MFYVCFCSILSPRRYYRQSLTNVFNAKTNQYLSTRALSSPWVFFKIFNFQNSWIIYIILLPLSFSLSRSLSLTSPGFPSLSISLYKKRRDLSSMIYNCLFYHAYRQFFFLLFLDTHHKHFFLRTKRSCVNRINYSVFFNISAKIISLNERFR